MEAVVDIILLATLVLLGLRVERNDRIVDAKLNALRSVGSSRFQISKDLYEEGQRTLTDHIQAPVHRR